LSWSIFLKMICFMSKDLRLLCKRKSHLFKFSSISNSSRISKAWPERWPPFLVYLHSVIVVALNGDLIKDIKVEVTENSCPIIAASSSGFKIGQSFKLAQFWPSFLLNVRLGTCGQPKTQLSCIPFYLFTLLNAYLINFLSGGSQG